MAEATPEATAADLLAAIGRHLGWVAPARGLPDAPDPHLRAIGRPVPPTARLGHPPLLDTAYLEWVEDTPDLPAHALPTTSLLQLHVLRGPDAGLIAPLTAGDHVLGRGLTTPLTLTDPSMSRDHALLQLSSTQIMLVDRSSTNGTTVAGAAQRPAPQPLRVNDEFTCGSTTFALRAAPGMPAATRPDGRGHLLVSPAPPPPAWRAPAPVQMPDEPTPTPPPRLSVLGAALPLAFGAVLAVIMHSPTMLAFGLMGPAISVGTWWSERRAGRRADERAVREFARTRDEALRQVDAALTEEAAERLAADPDPSTMAAWALGPLSSVWDRTGSTPAKVRIGIGDVPAQTSRSDGHALRVRAPVVIGICERGTTALVGPPEATRPVARAIIATAMTRFTPHDLRVILPSVDRAEWSWAEGAPHCRPAAARLMLRVVEGAAESFPGHTIALVRDEAHLPTDCRRRILLPDCGDAFSARLVHADGEATDVDLDAMSRAAAARLVDGLSPLRSSHSDVSGGALPDRVSLQPLVGSPESLADRWRRMPRSTRFALGCAAGDTDDPVVLDLVVDGPHCLVGGTTGSGKSELLITMVATLAAANRPDELCFVLVDYKGGAAFGACRDLPHVVGLVTDLDPAGAARAITSLTAELKRRESLLAARGCADLTAYQRVCREGDPRIPRLVIMIDEFRTLADEFPLLIDGLVRIAAQGRSLGIHLVIATQRPGGAVTADMRANLSLRIALRVRDTVDSLDVIDSPAAATLPADLPGRAIVTTARSGLVALQTGYAHAPLASASAPVTILSVDGITVPRQQDPSGERPTVLEALVDASRQAVAEVGISVPASPWLAPLPALVQPGDLPTPTEPGAVLGIVDDPHAQAQYGWEFAPGHGSLAICGGPKTGRSGALRTVATQLTAQFSPSELHLYAVHTGALADLGHLPHCGAAVPAVDIGRVDRLLSLLTDHCEIPRVLLVDDVEQILESLGSQYPHVRDGLASLIRHGNAGLTIVAAGGRSLVTGSLASGFARRLVLLPRRPGRPDTGRRATRHRPCRRTAGPSGRSEQWSLRAPRALPIGARAHPRAALMRCARAHRPSTPPTIRPGRRRIRRPARRGHGWAGSRRLRPRSRPPPRRSHRGARVRPIHRPRQPGRDHPMSRPRGGVARRPPPACLPDAEGRP
ncbi:MAG: FtsK/SpoIIIE domain-containing protein [Dermatophilaceae bacterium]